MLSYVFWHAPVPDADAGRYEDALATFHAALGAAEPEGFLRSQAFRVEGGPWLPGGRGYEDWYQVRDSAALDPLDETAVSARLRTTHDAAARRAGWGSGGLYRLLRAGAEPGPVSACAWFGKPPGRTYEAFHSALAERLPGATIWQRKMTLGPALEYCAVLPNDEAARDLPPEWRVELVRRWRVWG